MNTKRKINSIHLVLFNLFFFFVCFERVNVLGFLFQCNSSNNNSINYYASPVKRFELYILKYFTAPLRRARFYRNAFL